MNQNFLLKFFTAVILVAFMNLSFSPFVFAMEEREGEERPLLRAALSVQTQEEGTEPVLPTHALVQVTENDLLVPFLAYCQRCQERPEEGGVIMALSALEMGLGSKPSRLQAWGPPIAAVIVTTGAALALAELYMFNDPVGVLFKIPSQNFSGLPPTPLVIAGVVAGALILVTAPFQMTERFTQMTNASSQYTAKAESKKSIKKKIILGILTWGTCGVLSIKSLLAFVQTNINQGTSFGTFAAVTGPFFGVYKLIGSRHVAKEKWTFMFQWCGEKIDSFRGTLRRGEEERDLLRTRLANSFRKIIFDKAAGGKKTEELFDTVHALHKAGKQQQIRWDKDLQNLKKQLSQASDQQQRQVLQSSLEDLKKRRDLFQRILTLATLKSLSDFDKDAASFPEHLRDPKWYGSQPWWYRAAQGSGVVLGGLSAYAIGWSWKYVFSTLVGTYCEDYPEMDDDGYTPYILPTGVSDTVATALTVFYAPYLTGAAVSILENLAGSVMKYNPIENDRSIEKSNLTYYRARGVANFLNWCSHTFQEVPAVLIGGVAMGWAGIPLAQQWWTLAPYMAVMGAGSHALSGEVLQKNITKLMNRFERSKGGVDHKRQFIADLLKVSDDWLKTLKGPYVVELQGLLENFEALFETERVS